MLETYFGHVRTPQDAIILFEACRIGLLPRVQRRLSERERNQIRPGSVFVWDEREAGMRRWTDGKSWSASRVSGSFLTYREMEGKRGGNGLGPSKRKHGLRYLSNSEVINSHQVSTSNGQMLMKGGSAMAMSPSATTQSAYEMDTGDDPDGYHYKINGLMKQSFSITTASGQHLHLISYYARSHFLMQSLRQPSTDPALRGILPQRGLYPEPTVFEPPSGHKSSIAPKRSFRAIGLRGGGNGVGNSYNQISVGCGAQSYRGNYYMGDYGQSVRNCWGTGDQRSVSLSHVYAGNKLSQDHCDNGLSEIAGYAEPAIGGGAGLRASSSTVLPPPTGFQQVSRYRDDMMNGRSGQWNTTGTGTTMTTAAGAVNPLGLGSGSTITTTSTCTSASASPLSSSLSISDSVSIRMPVPASTSIPVTSLGYSSAYRGTAGPTDYNSANLTGELYSQLPTLVNVSVSSTPTPTPNLGLSSASSTASSGSSISSSSSASASSSCSPCSSSSSTMMTSARTTTSSSSVTLPSISTLARNTKAMVPSIGALINNDISNCQDETIAAGFRLNKTVPVTETFMMKLNSTSLSSSSSKSSICSDTSFVSSSLGNVPISNNSSFTGTGNGSTGGNGSGSGSGNGNDSNPTPVGMNSLQRLIHDYGVGHEFREPSLSPRAKSNLSFSSGSDTLTSSPPGQRELPAPFKGCAMNYHLNFEMDFASLRKLDGALFGTTGTGTPAASSANFPSSCGRRM